MEQNTQKKTRSKPLTRALKVIQVKNQIDDAGSNPSNSLKCRSVKKLKDARRALSHWISEYQRGTITSEKVKTLTYLLISFVNISREIETEDKLTELERKMEGFEDGNV